MGIERKIDTESLKSQIFQFLETLKQKTDNVTRDQIFNMDETPYYIDMIGNSTIDFIGSKNVEVNGTGHSKMCFSVVLTIQARCTLEKTLVILKGLKKV